MKLRLVIELDYNAEMMHSDDPEAIAWFREEILGGELILHSNEIGDEVGAVRVLSVEDAKACFRCGHSEEDHPPSRFSDDERLAGCIADEAPCVAENCGCVIFEDPIAPPTPGRDDFNTF